MLNDIRLLPFFINEDLVLLPQDRQLRDEQTIADKVGAGQHGETASRTTASPDPTQPVNSTPLAATSNNTAAAPAPSPAKETKPAARPMVNPNLIFGKNQKELLVLVEDYNNPVMERNDGLLLKDILKAIGYTFDDVAIVNISHCREEVDWEAVNGIPFQTLFSFGISHPKIPVTSTLAPYELERSGERKFLLTDKLSVLRQDRSRKIALWNLLKKFFV